MSLSTSSDPVETIRLALDDNTSGGDWSNAGSKPSVIEKIEAVRHRTKRKRSEDSLYIWSPDTGTIEGFGASWGVFEETHFVAVSCVTKDSDTQARNLVRDVRSIIVTNYSNDNFGSTNWQYIRPITEDDLRHEKIPNKADTYSYTILLELMADRDS